MILIAQLCIGYNQCMNKTQFIISMINKYNYYELTTQRMTDKIRRSLGTNIPPYFMSLQLF